MTTMRHISVFSGVGVVNTFNSSPGASNLSATAEATCNFATQDQLKYTQLITNALLRVVIANALVGFSNTTMTAISNGSVYKGSIINSVLHMVGVTASGQNNCVP